MTTGTNALQVANRALAQIARGARLASGTVLSNFDATPAGITVATLYTGAVETLIRNQDFEFCRRQVALVTTGGTPPLGWTQEYTLPPDCLRVRQVVPVLPLSDPFDPQPIRWDVGDVSVSGIITLTSFSAAGAGYAANDTGTILGGATAATYRILTVSAGVPQTISITGGGSDFTVGQICATATGGSQPGAGSGMILVVSSVTFTAQPVIWTNEASAKLIYSTSYVTEVDWDSMFTEQMVDFLASQIAIAVGGRPDFSRERLDVAGKIGNAGMDKDS